MNDEWLPISLVAHTVFCPRRAWLEAIGEQPPRTAQMAVGTEAHRRVDTPTSRDDVRTVRGIAIRHGSLGYHGRIDRAERVGDNALRVIEHKATPLKRRPEVSDANRVQLALQAMALQDQGFDVVDTGVYFPQHHTTVFVDVDEVREEAVEWVEKTRRIVSAKLAPPPLQGDPKCDRCSHASICLPEERQESDVRRKILAPDPHAEVLHLTTPGSRAMVSAGRLRVVKSEENLASIPLERVAAVVVHGNVDLSGGLTRELLWRGLPIVWCSGRGRVVGWASGATPPNGGARFMQFEEAARGRPDLAGEMISTKISNQATILRRFGGADETVKALRGHAKTVRDAQTIQEIFGVEGKAAALYFGAFPGLLKSGEARDLVEGFPGRVGRGAVDPLNVALNYAYGMLLDEVTRAVLACGLDPHAGFLHSSGCNKPALALDLMEEFRAPLGDAVILGAFNNGELGASSFTTVLGDARLSQVGKRKVIAAVERRLSTEFTHPVFGYRITWRRTVEVQVRMLLGVLDGTQPDFRGVRVR